MIRCQKRTEWYIEMKAHYLVADTPDGDGDAGGSGQASLDDGGVVVGGCVNDIKLCVMEIYGQWNAPRQKAHNAYQ